MGKTLQEQLREVRSLVRKLEVPVVAKPQVARWVVWRKNGNDYRKVRLSDGLVVEV